MNFNFKGGLGLIRKSLFSYMASRSFFWTLAFSWMMGPLVYLFVWVVAAGNGSVGGFNRNDFIFYYLILIVVNQMTYPASHWIIGESVQDGRLSVSLLRPLPVIYEGIAADIALKVVCLPFVLAFVFIIGFTMGFHLIPALQFVPLFILSLALSQILRFMMAYDIALLAFWTQKIESLLSINDTFVFLLAGQVAPVALLPGVIGKIAVIMPYRYMLGFPVEVLMGKLAGNDILIGLSFLVSGNAFPMGFR